MKIEEQVRAPRKRIGAYLPTYEERKLMSVTELAFKLGHDEYFDNETEIKSKIEAVQKHISKFGGNEELDDVLVNLNKKLGEVKQMKIEEQVKQILEEKLHVKIRHDGEELFDMGADSLDLIEIADELEEKFEIKIKDEELSNELTVRDVVRMVKSKVGTAEKN